MTRRPRGTVTHLGEDDVSGAVEAREDPPEQQVTVALGNSAPTITSSSTPSVAEGTTSVVTVTANDPESDPVTFSLTGGADQAKFSIDGVTGA